jgi:hypothetical protein
MNNIDELQNFLTVAFLISGIIFNLAFSFYTLKDLNKRVTKLEKLIYRLISRGNRKLNWDFPFVEEEED